MSQYVPDENPPIFIEDIGQLVESFTQSCKPRDRWRIGTEFEKVTVRAADAHAALFSGGQGIEALLKGMAERFGWDPLRDGDRVVALRRGGASITLEPGGQVELSGEPFATVHETARELREHVVESVTVGGELGLAFLGLGMQPISRLEEIEWVPKQRYRIMAPYMLRVGTLGQRMMKQTATVQVNLDFASEADAMAKMRTGMGLAPLVSAMFANSPISDGDLNRYMTFRGHVWTDTDNARSGLLRFVFRANAGFIDYVDYALDVPMYFIIRDGWIDMTAYTFRRFLNEGYRGHRATMADWHAHLTTLFPEVRLKGYIELRSADSQAPELLLALPALAKGVLYDDDALQAAWDLVKAWSWEERLALWDDAHRRALAATIRGLTLRDLCRELLAIAEYGLRRQDCRNPRGLDETIYLERLVHEVRKGRCPADRVRESWLREWSQDVRKLVAGTAYTLEAAERLG
jgi:glutamate--cysteine ligase